MPVAALALALSACGGAKNRLTIHTPETATGKEATTFPIPAPTPAPTATPEATPKPQGGPVTPDERRVIRGWSDALREDHVAAASNYFTIPSLVSNGGGLDTLASKADVRQFNATLTCGAKLVKTRRSVKHFVIGTFQLTERAGHHTCGTGTGHLAEVAFFIAHHHITQWVRVADPTPDPTPTPTPTDPSQT